MGIVDLIFPKICVGCRKEGEYICLNCSKKLVAPAPICPMCCKASIDGWAHPRCRTRYGMDRLIVGLPYRGLVQECLKKVKYKSSWDIIQFLYDLCEFGEMGKVIVTSVPMWREKARQRGFNQADMIAKCLDDSLPGVSRQAKMLERARETKPMFGLKKEERKENVKGAFKLLNHYTIRPLDRRVILVDDVWTTGATMRECCKVLKEVGIKEVWGITLAR